MSDQDRRALERQTHQGDVEAQVRLAQVRLREGARDPRRWPRWGDVVRVAVHGANVERWDTRRVVPCSEASGWDADWRSACFCDNAEDTRPLSFARGAPELHWERTPGSFRSLEPWGLARVRRGRLRLNSWRTWSRLAEVVVIVGLDRR